MKKIYLFIIGCFILNTVNAGTQLDSFMLKLKQYCGKSFEGTITAGGRDGDGFTGKKLKMQIKVCGDTIKIPFFVGDDKSRVWVLTKQNGYLKLKHAHTHEDGKPDKVTQYGGVAPNTGFSGMQFFPADEETCSLIPYACSNVWWMTVNDTSFTYNLRRIGSDRLFTVTFDLTKPTNEVLTPWGW